MHYVNRVQDRCKQPHYAVLVFTANRALEIERGFPRLSNGLSEEIKPVMQYIAFDSIEEMKKWIERARLKEYQLLRVEPVEVEYVPVITGSEHVLQEAPQQGKPTSA